MQARGANPRGGTRCAGRQVWPRQGRSHADMRVGSTSPGERPPVHPRGRRDRPALLGARAVRLRASGLTTHGRDGQPQRCGSRWQGQWAFHNGTRSAELTRLCTLVPNWSRETGRVGTANLAGCMQILQEVGNESQVKGHPGYRANTTPACRQPRGAGCSGPERQAFESPKAPLSGKGASANHGNTPSTSGVGCVFVSGIFAMTEMASLLLGASGMALLGVGAHP